MWISIRSSRIRATLPTKHFQENYQQNKIFRSAHRHHQKKLTKRVFHDTQVERIEFIVFSTSEDIFRIVNELKRIFWNSFLRSKIVDLGTIVSFEFSDIFGNRNITNRNRCVWNERKENEFRSVVSKFGLISFIEINFCSRHWKKSKLNSMFTNSILFVQNRRFIDESLRLNTIRVEKQLCSLIGRIFIDDPHSFIQDQNLFFRLTFSFRFR